MTNEQTKPDPEPTGDLHGPKAVETVSKLSKEQLEELLAEKGDVNG